jgi:hypothetical protein
MQSAPGRPCEKSRSGDGMINCFLTVGFRQAVTWLTRHRDDRSPAGTTAHRLYSCGPIKSLSGVSTLSRYWVRTAVPILFLLAVAACASAPTPSTWTRADGRATDPPQLEADKTICRGEMDQAELVTNARGLVAIQLPGQESPSLKVYIGCMARRGYTAGR